MAKQSKPQEPPSLPEQFTLSALERSELETQLATKKWVDARFELAQRDHADAARVLEGSYKTWSEKLGRRLKIKPEDMAKYSYAPDGVCKLKEPQPATPATPETPPTPPENPGA